MTLSISKFRNEYGFLSNFYYLDFMHAVDQKETCDDSSKEES